MRKVSRFTWALIILALLGCLLIQCTRNGKQPEDVGAAAFVPLAPGNNIIGQVTVTTFLDPPCYNIDLVNVSAYVVDVTDAMTVGTGFANNGPSTLTGTVTAIGHVDVGGQLDAANGLEVTQNITQTSGTALLNKGIVTDSLEVKGELLADNGIQADGSVTMTGALLANSGSFTSTLTGQSQMRADNGLRITQNITQVSGSFLLNTGSVSSTFTGLGQVQADNGLRVTQNITQVSGSFILNSGNVSSTLGVAGVGTFSSQLQADNGLRLTGAVTQVSGIAYLNQVNVTGTVSVGSELSAANGLLLTGNLTQTSGTALFSNAGVTNNMTVSGDFTVTGTCNNCGGAGSSTFTDEIDAQAGVSVTGGVTVSQNLTVTGWAGLGGTYMAVSSTVDYTSTQTIIVVAGKTIYPVTAGGPEATLNDTTSISDGFYLGQIIYIVNVDTQDHNVIIKNNANTKIGADLMVSNITNPAGAISIVLWWNGSDWWPISF